MKQTESERLLNIQAFRDISMMFLKSMNPRLEREVVVMDAIYAYRGPLPEHSMRYFAHQFVRSAERIIDKGLTVSTSVVIDAWITQWNKEFGLGDGK